MRVRDIPVVLSPVIVWMRPSYAVVVVLVRASLGAIV